MPWPRHVCGSVGVGGLCGLTNGLLITRVKLPPFIVTKAQVRVVPGHRHDAGRLERQRPQLLFVPTASADNDEYIVWVHERFDPIAQVTHLKTFPWPPAGLREVIDKPAAAAGLVVDAALVEASGGTVVVVRGDQPMPPRDMLELRLPPDAAKALEEQARAQQEQQQEQQQGKFSELPDPFERGPETTETR